MARGLRPWWLALVLSLLLHASLIGGLESWLPQWDALPEPVPFDVQLVPAVAPVVAPESSAPSSPSVRRPQLQAASRPVTPPPLEPTVETVVMPAPEPVPDTVVVPAEAVAVEKATIALSADSEAAPPLNPLPPRLDLRFQVRYGLATGMQTLQWVNEGERYTVVSVAEATGLAGVFYRGHFVQTSRGRITPRGLQPEEFWDQRGAKRSSARFDIDHGLLTLEPAKGAPRHFAYQGAVQDVLSLFFQLALTAPPPQGRLTYTVFNGKKLRDYAYVVRGEVTLQTELGELRTLHLARLADGDGRFEVWLAIDRHYLPVRVLRGDEKGSEVELRLQSISP